MTITWNTDVNAPCCPGEIVAEDGRTLLIQTDWDYPGTARSFGWDMRTVQKPSRRGFDFKTDCGVMLCEDCGYPLYPMEVCHEERPDECPECGGHCTQFAVCDHGSSDGTVDCKECGCTASKFIEAAGEWLRENDGATADDPGYFSE